jgi:hypothetical protein
VSTVTDLPEANLHEVFGNRDAAARESAIERIYAEDVVFSDPARTVQGRVAAAASSSNAA